MCDGRDEKFVVPIRPFAGSGLFVGRVLESKDRHLRVEILRADGNDGENLISCTRECVKEFGSFAEAMDYLLSKTAPASD